MDQWNAAVQRIEEALEGVVEVQDLARMTATSEYHFRRMFSALSGMPLSEYVRRRRLTVAAAAVVAGDEAIQDIAVRFGYGSADAFSRAFRAVHGIGPRQARKTGAALRAQPQLRFTLTIEGAAQMDYRLVHKEKFTLVGRRRRMSLIHHGPNPEMIAFQDELGERALEVIHELSSTEPAGVLAVCTEFEEVREDGGTFEYWLAAAAEPGLELDTTEEHQLETLAVSAHTWLVLSSEDAEVASIQKLWPEAYGQWLPANPYRPVQGPELVNTVYDEHWSPLHAELWLPVEREATTVMQ